MAQRMENLTLDGLPVGTEEDKALTLAFQRGSKGAYQQIHDRYRDRVQRVCRRMLPNPQDAQDATQETFLRVYQALGRFNGRYQLGAWITRIATNVCLDHIRAKSRRPNDVLPIEVIDLAATPARELDAPDSIVIRRSESRRVRKVLASLPPMHRAAIVLRDFEGLSYQEVAAVLEITECQVKALIHRARQSFKRSWTSLGSSAFLPTRLFQRGRKVHAPKAEAGASPPVQQLAETITASAAPAVSSCSAAVGHCGQFVADRFAPALTAVAVGVASLAMPGKIDAMEAPEAASPQRVGLDELASASDATSVRLHRSAEAVEHASLAEAAATEESLGTAAPLEAPSMAEPVPTVAPDPTTEPEPSPTPASPAASEPSPSAGGGAGAEQPPEPTPQPSQAPAHPSGFSFSFAWDGVFSGRSCQCMGPTTVHSETGSVTESGSMWFDQSLSGTGTAAGTEAFGVRLDHHLRHSGYQTRLWLATAEGSYGYGVSAAFVERHRTGWGGWSYTYSGAYDLQSRPSNRESVPEGGSFTIVVEASPAEQRLVAVRISLTESR